MGEKAKELRRARELEDKLRAASDAEREGLAKARYEGSARHKLRPQEFGLSIPAVPRWTGSLCDADDVGLTDPRVATTLFIKAVTHGLVSEATAADNLPRRLFVVDEGGRPFEAEHAGGSGGAYHGYPIRRNEPLFDVVIKKWNDLHAGHDNEGSSS